MNANCTEINRLTRKLRRLSEKHGDQKRPLFETNDKENLQPKLIAMAIIRTIGDLLHLDRDDDEIVFASKYKEEELDLFEKGVKRLIAAAEEFIRDDI